MSDNVRRILRGIGGFFATVFGILGWIVQGFLEVMVLSMIVVVIAALLIYARVKPDLDYCREVAYEKLSEMDRHDFQMLSDTEVFDKDGNVVGLINSGHYEYVPINDISVNLQNAYIAAEDRRFRSHNGVDWIATIRAGLALIKNRGEITQGGSTITQQVIKNTYLTQEQSFTRKITEILLAPEIEKKYSKADIMEFYCNTNFYGNHRYGVQAASQYYFDKNASDLTSWEAAVLAAISNSPSAYDPVRNPEDCLEKRNSILGEMLEVGFLTEDEYNYAVSRPLEIVRNEGESTNENYQTSYALHCAALELMKQDGFNFRYTFLDKQDYDEYNDAYQTLYNDISEEIRAGGYKIYTSLDSDLQNILQENIDSTLGRFTEIQEENGKYALQGAGVIVNNITNYVVAIVGGRGTDDIYNRAYLSARQPGSTIKPLLVYTPAFDTGQYYPSRIVDDHKWDDGPSNSGNHYYGNITIREALNRSLNTVAWQVLQDIGVNYGLDYLGRMEFQKITYVDNGVAALAIGGFTNGLRVVDMAKGYSTLANMGIYNDNTCLVGLIHEQKGDMMANHTEHSYRVYDEDSAYMTTDILKGTLTLPYATGYGLALSGGMPAAGKTGTTNNSRDGWFCGYTRYYTTAIWMGYDTPRNMPGIYGATYAGRIWHDVMNTIHEGLEPLDWDVPETIVVQHDNHSGTNDLFSITADVRAAQNAHEKEQQSVRSDILYLLGQYENRTVSSDDDMVLAEAQYQRIFDLLSTMDDSEDRTLILNRLENKHNELLGITEDIDEYASEQAADDAASQTERRLEELDEQTRRNEFLSALSALESLQYQTDDADELVQDAIAKLSLISTSEAASYRERLQAAINRISTLPTEDEYNSRRNRSQSSSQSRSSSQSQSQSQAQQQQQLQDQLSQIQSFIESTQQQQQQQQQQNQAAENSSQGVSGESNVIVAPAPDTSNSGPGVAGPGASGSGGASDQAQDGGNVIIVGGGD